MKRALGVFWTRLGRPSSEGAAEDPRASLAAGEVAFGYRDGEWLVRIRPDGTVLFGEGYTPQGAAEEFWKALAAYHPNVTLDERSAEVSVHTSAMEDLLLRIGRADLHNEAMQLAAAREEATEHDRFQAQLALSNLEVAVHRVIEFGRGLAVRIRGRV